MEFYKCSHCGNIIAYAEDKGVPVVCCGEKMEKIVPNSVDASGEKHVPVVKVDGNIVTVTVGSVEHPMLDVHYIQWIVLEKENGYEVKNLTPDVAPYAEFLLAEGEKAVAAYEYCNLHGLWKADI